MILLIKGLILQYVGGSLLLAGTYCSLKVCKVIICKLNALVLWEEISYVFVFFTCVNENVFFRTCLGDVEFTLVKKKSFLKLNFFKPSLPQKLLKAC